jgi:hypothetical protein
MSRSDNKIKKFAEHLVILEFMKSRFDIFQNVISDDEVDYVIKSKTGKYYEILLKAINLESDRSIHINKSEYGFELREKLYIALVLFMKEMDPAIYLIPFNVFEHPNQIFINHDQGERFNHLSTWEIMIFTKAIPELKKFAFNTIATQII